MMGLLVFKERLKVFYSKFDFYINPVIKFVFSLSAFLIMNQNIGYMTKLKGAFVPLVLALICSFLPFGGIAFIAGGFMLGHLYSVSFELALVTLVLLIMIALLYYGFQPGDSYLLVLTPLFFFLKIPYAIPLLVGLSGSLVSIIPVSCGILIYYLLIYVKQSAGVLTGESIGELTQKFMQIVKSIISNETMLVMIAAFSLAILVVFIFKNLSVDYAWIIAIVMGTITQLVVIFIGDINMNITVSVLELIFGVLGSVILAGIYHFFVFTVDYSRTEYVQFEDDDYYYYVKAVPKVAVSAPDVKVQKINTRKGQRTAE